MEVGEGLKTLECLRGRLLAERQASRSAKEEAELMGEKVMSNGYGHSLHHSSHSVFFSASTLFHSLIFTKFLCFREADRVGESD